MRSSLVVLSIISAAISGCGKNVDRSASAVTTNGQSANPGFMPAGNIQDVRTSPGCADSIRSLPYRTVENFADIAQGAGQYRLTTFDAVGSITLESGEASHGMGSSVVSGSMNGGVPEYKQGCLDLAQVPQTEMDWSAEFPTEIGATTGALSSSLSFNQRVRSDQPARDQLTPGNLSNCGDVSSLLRGNSA
ncbi:MAG: hypothetical protein H7301_03985, partial [Cryobacterium sp.]|nr:hypothetical protein [Oligoflexia bacterium]